MAGESKVPAFGLYGEGQLFPEVLHVEKIFDRAQGHAWKIAPHRHPHLHQFLMIDHGRADLLIDSYSTVIKPGMILNLPPWTVHGFLFEPGTEGLVMSLPVSEYPKLFETGPASIPLKHWFATNASDRISTALQSLFDVYQRGNFARREMLKTYATLIGLLLADASADSTGLTANAAGESLIIRFETMVRKRFSERLRLSDYAKDLAVSVSHLSRTCRDTTGTSPSRFIESVVFKEACAQLAYTNIRVAQIGYDLGFQDAAYFSRAFRKHTGMSPGDYRRSMTPINFNGQSAPSPTD